MRTRRSIALIAALTVIPISGAPLSAPLLELRDEIIAALLAPPV